MPTEQKIAIVAETTDRMRTAAAIFFTNFKGLSAPQASELRAQLRANRIEYKVVKKTLCRLAAHDAGVGEIEDFLQGQVGMAFSYDDPAVPAKILRKFSKKNQNVPAITGIILDGQAVPASRAEELAMLPARDVLLAQLASTLQRPMATLAATLKGAMSQLARVLASLKDQKTS